VYNLNAQSIFVVFFFNIALILTNSLVLHMCIVRELYLRDTKSYHNTVMNHIPSYLSTASLNSQNNNKVSQLVNMYVARG
jgi:hypothetical protein